MNPYVGHPDPFKEGQELFRKGLLSEAVLALEAEALTNPENAEGWRLLGIAHAENDDDQQVSASSSRYINVKLSVHVRVRLHTFESSHTPFQLDLYWVVVVFLLQLGRRRSLIDSIFKELHGCCT